MARRTTPAPETPAETITPSGIIIPEAPKTSGVAYKVAGNGTDPNDAPKGSCIVEWFEGGKRIVQVYSEENRESAEKLAVKKRGKVFVK
jgi:hypothetical protein